MNPAPARVPLARRVRCYALGIGGALLVLVPARLSWGCYAEHRLEQEIARHRSMGEPVLPADFVRRAVADEENAATFLQKATQAYVAVKPAPDELIFDLLDDPTLIVEQRDRTAKFLAECEGVFAEIRSAVTRPECEWGIMPDRNGLAAAVLSKTRLIDKSLAIAAIAAHLDGDDVAALRRIREAIDLARFAGRLPSLLGVLVESGQFALVANSVEFIAPELGARAPHAPEWREQTETIVKILLDDSYLWEASRHAVLSERAHALDVVDGYLENPVAVGLTPSTVERTWNWLCMPAWRLLQARIMSEYAALAKIRDHREWPLMAKQFPEPRLMSVVVSQPSLREVLNPSNTRFSIAYSGKIVARGIAAKRMAAIALAIRLYVLDVGVAPQSLDQLVPRYLPSVPIDPADPQHGPIRYRASASRPMLYSLGNNEVDDSPSWIDVPDAHNGPNMFRRYKESRADDSINLKRENIPRSRYGAASQPGQAVQNDTGEQKKESGNEHSQQPDEQP